MTTVSRRLFLQIGAGATGALVVGFGWSDTAAADARPMLLGNYVSIGIDGTVTVRAPNPEIGQGVKTSLPMLIAEELDVDWDRVRVEMAPNDPQRFGQQDAGGSMSIHRNYTALRRVGAAARWMLVDAAARQLNASHGEFSTAHGRVHHSSGRSFDYGELAVAASLLRPPDPKSLVLKDPAKFSIIGTSRRGVDSARIVRGEPLFGIDMTIPDMAYAVYVKAPVFGARLLRCELAAARAERGIIDVFTLKGQGDRHGLQDGIAIIASSWWYAQAARAKLEPLWDTAIGVGHDSTRYRDKAHSLLAKPGTMLEEKGDVEAALAQAAQRLTADYEVPFLAHAPLEPQNCTARVKGDSVEIWAPTQTPEEGRQLVARTLGVAPDSVVVHMRRAGGGFGRRLENDYMAEAASIARHAGVPIKLVWSREDDFAHDFYRTASYHRLRAGLDKRGRISAFAAHGVTFAHGSEVAQAAGIEGNGFESSVVPASRLEQSLIPTIVPTGYLRAPVSNGLAFVRECFWDELALAANMDPVAFRLAALSNVGGSGGSFDAARMRAVLEAVALRSNWARPRLAKGQGMGVACYFSHSGYFAEVARVRVDADGHWQVLNVWVAGDIGSQIVNPLAARAQVEGAVMDGIGSMHAEITVVNGAAIQTNFDAFPLLRMPEAPVVDVEFVMSAAAPTGLGEPALPPVLPAVANAIHAACGARVRQLPLTAARIQAARRG